MRKFFRRFLSDRKAATAIEYGLIAAGIAIAIAAVVILMGSRIADLFGNVLVATLGG